MTVHTLSLLCAWGMLSHVLLEGLCNRCIAKLGMGRAVMCRTCVYMFLFMSTSITLVADAILPMYVEGRTYINYRSQAVACWQCSRCKRSECQSLLAQQRVHCWSKGAV